MLETLSPLKFIQNNSVKLEILRFMRPNYADKGRCIIKEGETTGGVVFLISGRAIITKSRVIRKPLTVDTVLPPHIARRRGGIADFSSGIIIIIIIIIIIMLLSYLALPCLILSYLISSYLLLLSTSFLSHSLIDSLSF